MSGRADQPGVAGDTPAGDSSLRILEEKARRLLKRCRYGEAGRCFQQVVGNLELVVDANPTTMTSTSNGVSRSSREIGAWEGLALCLSRQLDDAGAEAAQRKALALRCRQWEGSESESASSRAGSGERWPASEAFAPGANSPRVAAAKRAALPCLRNLASFVANQGRHVDAEVILRTVLEHHDQELRQGRLSPKSTDKGKPTEHEDGFGGGKPPGLAVSPPLPPSTLADLSFSPDARPSSSGVEEEKRSEQEPDEGLPSAACRASHHETYSSSSNSSEESEPRTRRSLSPTPKTPNAAGAAFFEQPATSGTVDRIRDGVNTPLARELTPPPPTRPPPSSREASPAADRASRSGVPPAPPPPSPVPPMKQHENSVGVGRFSSSGDERGRRESGDRWVEGEDSGEAGDAGREEEEEEDLEQMAAVTKHHLAVVLHSQGRAKEAELLLEESLQVLRRRQPPQAVWIAQALHDLARVVRPREPARACALYREALQLLEDARGVNHFLTAPTLAKLGCLLGEYLIATPISPAAPAGPGAVGVARAAGLAEAVCAPAEQAAGRSSAEAVAAAAGDRWDAKEAEAMIKRAVLIQGRHLGLRHPSVASSMRAMAELYRRQGRLSEAEPLFRRAIGIWEASPGPMDSDAVAALHGLAHCVLAGTGADWLGRFEEAFACVDQAYRIASSQPGNDPSSKLLLEALRMIRSRQRQGRGDPQPASATIMKGIWSGRWDPSNNEGGGGCGGGAGSGEVKGHTRSRSGSGDNPRCAVCLEEIGAAAAIGGEESGSDRSEKEGALKGLAAVASVEWTADIGSEEARLAGTENAHAKGSFAYLPCGHRFHMHCIGRWLAHSSSCPSCRSRVEEEEEPPAKPAPAAAGASAAGATPAEAGTATRSVGSQARRANGEEGGGGGGGGMEVGERGEYPAAARGVGVPDARAPFC
eukprot:g13438.t1